MKLNTFELTDALIKCNFNEAGLDFNHYISRTGFENWLTDGTGKITTVIGGKECKDTLEEYYSVNKEINDSSIKLHIPMYLNEVRDELTSYHEIYRLQDLLSLIMNKADFEMITKAIPPYSDAIRSRVLFIHGINA